LTDPISQFKEQLNTWGIEKTPFVFLIDYLAEKPLAWRVDQVDPSEIRYDFNGFKNSTGSKKEIPDHIQVEKYPVPFSEYERKFNHVVNNLKAGNSFLVNLSVPTPIRTNLSLSDIFEHSEAPYRFWKKDHFVCFSPEIFIKIKDGKYISSFPMKGTIDAALPDAQNLILSDPKESAEHATIVDLIRNDLSMVAEKVWVERYRYIDRITTNDKTLLQVSSEVAGMLPADFRGEYGDLIMKLLPAGSITGAPKPSTQRIIAEAEAYERGYYTGVMGYFDGQNFESAVMIRFIENQNGQLVFKSGGGVTASSKASQEYQEIIDKVYLPIRHASEIVH
jgi:para-aminobenzoate synthetase component 1